MCTQLSVLNAQLTTHVPPHIHVVTTGVGILCTVALSPAHQGSPVPTLTAWLGTSPSPKQVQWVFLPGWDLGPLCWPLPTAA